jgi:hypothetical protein
MGSALPRVIDHKGQQKGLGVRHRMGALGRELPFHPEITLQPSLGVRGNDGHEKGAFPNLPSDLLVPGIASSQFALVKPNLDPFCPERIANAPRVTGILRSVAQKNRPMLWAELGAVVHDSGPTLGTLAHSGQTKAAAS